MSGDYVGLLIMGREPRQAPSKDGRGQWPSSQTTHPITSHPSRAFPTFLTWLVYLPFLLSSLKEAQGFIKMRAHSFIHMLTYSCIGGYPLGSSPGWGTGNISRNGHHRWPHRAWTLVGEMDKRSVCFGLSVRVAVCMKREGDINSS